MLIIEVYTKRDCIWCDKVKLLLADNNLNFAEHLFGRDFTLETFQAVVKDPNVKTVPQVFVNGQRIGGYEDTVRWIDTYNTVEKM